MDTTPTNDDEQQLTTEATTTMDVVETTTNNTITVPKSCFGKFKKWKDYSSSVEQQFNLVTFTATSTNAGEFHVGFKSSNSNDILSVIVGARGNTECRIELNNNILESVFTGRVLNKDSYWIYFKQDIVSLGIGTNVGSNVLIQAPVESFTPSAIGFSTWNIGPVIIKDLSVTTESDSDVVIEPMSYLVLNDSGNDIVTPEQRQAFMSAYDTAKKRHERFNTTPNSFFKAPEIKSFLDTKLVRELQRTGTTTTLTNTAVANPGFDLMSADEIKKRESRRCRFNSAEDNERELEEKKKQDRLLKFGMTCDEPASSKVAADKIEYSLEDLNSVQRPDALHVYSLDDSFPQVRTSDVLTYFTGYAPSYVEWMNDSSCTVVFRDEHTASRALFATSVEIPSGIIWRKGRTAMSAKRNNSHKSWRILVRKATSNDFPGERQPKNKGRKYHHHHPRGQYGKRKRRHHRDDREDKNDSVVDEFGRTKEGGGLRGGGALQSKRSKPTN